MRIWKIIHAMRVNFGFTLGLLIAEGVLAVSMFIFPPASLLLVFLGLATIALELSAQGLLSLIGQKDRWPDCSESRCPRWKAMRRACPDQPIQRIMSS